MNATRASVVVLLCGLGCGSHGGGSDGAGGTPGSGDAGATGAHAAGSGAVAASAAGAAATGGSKTDSGGATTGSAGDSATSSGGQATPGAAGHAGSDGADTVSLPEGSREYRGILNLVDADAAQEMEDYLLETTQVHMVLRDGLKGAVNRFLELYPEEYDFIVFYPDHEIDDLRLDGRFQIINKSAELGTGLDFDVHPGGYRSDGRLKGIIGAPYRPDYYLPFCHEVLHYWANNLDPKFGFGVGADTVHWGFSSVNGQLGGFDEAALKCETPAGAAAPDCTPLDNGNTLYRVNLCAPNANGVAKPYAPLELYLMGLIAPSEVPESYTLFEQADYAGDGAVNDDGTVTIEASGMHTVTLQEIIARHGTVEPLPEAERHFSAAFVVVSETPASDEVLEDVANAAAVFGNRMTLDVIPSFEAITGGQATMDTELGPRRAVGDAVPPVRDLFRCNPLEQDCGDPKLGCYDPSFPLCALSHDLAENASCDVLFACAPGLDCASNASAPDAYSCQPYCDPDDPASPAACQTLCPNGSIGFVTQQGDPAASLCVPQ